MSRAFVFPGQGSQFVGMGKELADSFSEAKLVFEEVDDAIGENLSKIIFEGPIEDLTLTQNTQPALMAVSMAAVRVIEKDAGIKITGLCSHVAGHSLGEYSALCAAGAISLADTARLLRIRGNAMVSAVPAGQGGMAALLGVDFDKATKIAKSVLDVGDCQVANDNGGGQVVVSGDISAIDKVIEIASEFGAKRAVKLPVSAPFHSILMYPAAKIMEEALAEVEVLEPHIPIIANVTANIVTNPNEIRRLLVKQVTEVVRWRESVLALKDFGVEEMVEVGAGKVLTGLIKRIDKKISGLSLQTPSDIDEFLETV